MHKTPFFLVALLGMMTGAGLATAQEAPADLTTIRNYMGISDRLTTAGQIAYDQIPLLREEGYDVVVNLATASRERNSLEGFHVTESGMAYIHIPVDWEQPRLSDLSMFFDVMEANEGRKVFVHCFANMRASAFVYMYRTMVEGVAEEDALGAMNEVWDPAEVRQWEDLIERARTEFSGR
ncbi:MAG: phosphatase [Gemmatimonadales bacterium]|nr:phosphatase [Verrucomicrobiota bacterium]MBT3499884.1 phosphatase [Gemmatimonadales bacterium]MDG2238786.1 protein tyrosine phosphatase family protein [Longimicrobiales bacterium]MBT4186988.1 phosphatase [Gemmatimonadales bacterium]MBT5044480.1 phosphatase [Gemmatimonadales bacterium]